ncbi:DUF427 domain-containing protein [Duganella callida]|nr:DUF427 domain-containing protein [Duganella callida]
MRVELAGEWIADSEEVILLHEPGRYPVAYFPISSISSTALIPEERKTQHKDLGETSWFTVSVGGKESRHAAWQHTGLPEHASILDGFVAFAWRAMDGFYEEDERIFGHAADPYHRIDIRQTSRHLVVQDSGQTIAETRRPLVLYESGFAPRWYVPRADVDESFLRMVEGQTFCPYKGLASYYDIGERHKAAWSYQEAWPEAARISDYISFEADKIDVFIDEKKLDLEPGQKVTPHGIDRGLDPAELMERAKDRQ